MIYAGNPNVRALPIPTKPRDSGTTQPILRAPIKHGTVEGYRRHAEFGREPCLKCSLAMYAATKGHAPITESEVAPFQTDGRAEHGTVAGYKRHRRRGATPCDACKEANTAYSRWRRGTGPRPPWVEVKAQMGVDGINHGTPGGYQKHRKRKEEACDDCRKALAAYRRAYRERNAS